MGWLPWVIPFARSRFPGAKSISPGYTSATDIPRTAFRAGPISPASDLSPAFLRDIFSLPRDGSVLPAR